MSHKFVFALTILAMILFCAPAGAHDPHEKEAEPTFQLLRDSATDAAELELEEEEQARWEPAITGGSLEVSFFLGFLNLKHTVLAHDQIIYKYTEEATFWGDINMSGETAFNPGQEGFGQLLQGLGRQLFGAQFNQEIMLRHYLSSSQADRTSARIASGASGKPSARRFSK